MNSVKIDKLIHLVSQYPLLYDGKHKDYSDLYKRDCIWQRIGKELGVKAEVCKAKWNILRGGYRRALRNKECGVAISGRKWRFEDELSFLKDVVMERRRYVLCEKLRDRTDAENGTDNEEEDISVKEEAEPFSDEMQEDDWTSSPVNTEPERTVVLPSRSEHVVKESNVENDAVRQFFLSMAETVKTFPPLVQAQVKAEVFQCVNTVEIKYLQEKSDKN